MTSSTLEKENGYWLSLEWKKKGQKQKQLAKRKQPKTQKRMPVG